MEFPATLRARGRDEGVEAPGDHRPENFQESSEGGLGRNKLDTPVRLSGAHALYSLSSLTVGIETSKCRKNHVLVDRRQNAVSSEAYVRYESHGSLLTVFVDRVLHGLIVHGFEHTHAFQASRQLQAQVVGKPSYQGG